MLALLTAIKSARLSDGSLLKMSVKILCMAPICLLIWSKCFRLPITKMVKLRRSMSPAHPRGTPQLINWISIPSLCLINAPEMSTWHERRLPPSWAWCCKWLLGASTYKLLVTKQENRFRANSVSRRWMQRRRDRSFHGYFWLMSM